MVWRNQSLSHSILWLIEHKKIKKKKKEKNYVNIWFSVFQERHKNFILFLETNIDTHMGEGKVKKEKKESNFIIIFITILLIIVEIVEAIFLEDAFKY